MISRESISDHKNYQGLYFSANFAEKTTKYPRKYPRVEITRGYKKPPWNPRVSTPALAYGIFKLCVTCVVEDDKVGSDDLTEKIEAFEDEVQSVDIAAFQKI